MHNRINPLISFGITGMFIFGSIFAGQIIQAFWGTRDIWWTPDDKKLPFEKTKNSFVLFISNKPLEQHLDEGTLFALDNSSTQYRIVAKDVTARLNNWNEVKDTMLSSALFSAFCTGASFTCLIIGLAEMRRHNKKSL